jgi:hypothetical protein
VDRQNASKLNQLEKLLPEGLLVDAAWLQKRGYYGQLRAQYIKHGWLTNLAPRVYTRPRGALGWEQVVISLQSLLALPLAVGGRTALELQGYAHFLPHEEREVHLYGRRPLPSWLPDLSLSVRFVFHQSRRLFPSDPPNRGVTSLEHRPAEPLPESDRLRAGLVVQPWGHWSWPLALSTPERALLELLDELPDRESFDHVDTLVGGLLSLRPAYLQQLLEECTSVKVKRLFFFFADRHQPAWLRHLDRARVDLGKGKRMLVRGGRLDPVYQITVPETLDALR